MSALPRDATEHSDVQDMRVDCIEALSVLEHRFAEPNRFLRVAVQELQQAPITETAPLDRWLARLGGHGGHHVEAPLGAVDVA